MQYDTADGTAAAGSDYTAVSGGTVTFTGTDGETQSADVTVTGDTVVEMDETFAVALSNIVAAGAAPGSVTFSDNTATGTITNDDTATLAISDVSQAEGNGGTTNSYNFV